MNVVDLTFEDILFSPTLPAHVPPYDRRETAQRLYAEHIGITEHEWHAVRDAALAQVPAGSVQHAVLQLKLLTIWARLTLQVPGGWPIGPVPEASIRDLLEQLTPHFTLKVVGGHLRPYLNE